MRAQRRALICAFLSVIGIGISAYLQVVHIGMLRGELIGGAACGASGTIFNCHAVTASPVGTILGLPLALWGVLAYLATLALSLIAWQFSDWSERALTLLVGLSLALLLDDLVLLAIMVTQIQLLCPLCLATYAISAGLLVTATWALGKRWSEAIKQIPAALKAFLPAPRVAVVWIFWGVLLIAGSSAIALESTARYLTQGPKGMMRKQMTEFLSHQKRVAVTAQGDPTLGAANPSIRVVEFSDFRCPSCQRAWQLNPVLLAGHRQIMSLTFKHYPLDTDCNAKIPRQVHPGACQLAAASECAHEQGKFWEFHDLIFKDGPKYELANLERDAQQVGLNLTAYRECVAGGRGLEAVKRDIEEAARIGVSSTPTYVINGVVTVGAMPPAQFDEFLQTLQHAGESR